MGCVLWVPNSPSFPKISTKLSRNPFLLWCLPSLYNEETCSDPFSSSPQHHPAHISIPFSWDCGGWGRHLVLHPRLVLPFLVAVDMPWPPHACPGLRWDKETLAAVHGASSALGAVSGSADWLTLSHHSPVSRCRFEPCFKVQALRWPHPVCEQWACGTFWADCSHTNTACLQEGSRGGQS